VDAVHRVGLRKKMMRYNLRRVVMSTNDPKAEPRHNLRALATNGAEIELDGAGESKKMSLAIRDQHNWTASYKL
jgi:predicted metal-dependent phosphotriesterase family hydrolase